MKGVGPRYWVCFIISLLHFLLFFVFFLSTLFSASFHCDSETTMKTRSESVYPRPALFSIIYPSTTVFSFFIYFPIWRYMTTSGKGLPFIIFSSTLSGPGLWSWHMGGFMDKGKGMVWQGITRIRTASCIINRVFYFKIYCNFKIRFYSFLQGDVRIEVPPL